MTKSYKPTFDVHDKVWMMFNNKPYKVKVIAISLDITLLNERPRKGMVKTSISYCVMLGERRINNILQEDLYPSLDDLLKYLADV